MDIRFVETVIAAVEEGSLAAAARRQGITAAAAAQRVSALEQILGVALLRRDGRRMAATPDCEVLLPDLRAMLALRAGLAGRLAHQALSGTFRLGAVSTALGDFGVAVVQALKAQAPDVALSLTPAPSRDTFAAFEAGKLDAALIVAPPFALPKTMQFEVLAQQAIGLVTGSSRAPDAPFVVYSRHAWGGAACWQALQRIQGDAKILCELDAVEGIAQMVQDGLGQAVLPQWGGLARHFGDLRFDPLEAAPREIGLLTWRRTTARPIMALVRKALQLPLP